MNNQGDRTINNIPHIIIFENVGKVKVIVTPSPSDFINLPFISLFGISVLFKIFKFNLNLKKWKKMKKEKAGKIGLYFC